MASPANTETISSSPSTPTPVSEDHPKRSPTACLMGIPPIPSTLVEAETLDDARKILTEWSNAAVSVANDRNLDTIAAMAYQMNSILEEKFRALPEIQALQVQFDALHNPMGLECYSCGDVPRDPYVLPSCNHIHCGRCLDQQWRPVMFARLQRSEATSPSGVPILVLLQSATQNELGFQRVLRMVKAPKSFTTYTTPCCIKAISSLPLEADILTDLCHEAAYQRPPHQPLRYFSRLFRRF